MKKNKLVEIDPEEFGPGSEIDWENSRLIGATGTVYEDIRVRREDVVALFSGVLGTLQ